MNTFRIPGGVFGFLILASIAHAGLMLTYRIDSWVVGGDGEFDPATPWYRIMEGELDEYGNHRFKAIHFG